MDMFYSATEGIVKHRRRFHFHEVSNQWRFYQCAYNHTTKMKIRIHLIRLMITG